MIAQAHSFSRLDAKRQEQTPQALACLVVVGLFAGLWFTLWLGRIPMPVPFLIVLLAEVLFFLVYWRTVSGRMPGEHFRPTRQPPNLHLEDRPGIYA